MNLYFIALLPPKNLQKQIRELKLEIAERYKAKRALKLPAHLTLQIPFRMEPEKEGKLTQLLEGFSTSNQEFSVKLQNFGRFEQKVIFINIENHDPLIRLHDSLQKKLNDFLEFKKGEEFSKIHPHITLATRDLHYKQFSPAWADFKTRNFDAEFMAKTFCLFKHNGQTWDIFKKFELRNNS